MSGLFLDYENEDFPAAVLPNTQRRLNVTWEDILWAAITVGRPDIFHVFRFGTASIYEAIFRWSMVRMALQQRGANAPLFLLLARWPRYSCRAFVAWRLEYIISNNICSGNNSGAVTAAAAPRPSAGTSHDVWGRLYPMMKWLRERVSASTLSIYLPPRAKLSKTTKAANAIAAVRNRKKFALSEVARDMKKLPSC